jgi:Fur family ferric uptake transcriptional regulator
MTCSLTLKENGFRMTPQRRLILDVIHDAEGHVTADHIIEYVESRVPGVNKSTIYRTLELLESLGCVYKSRHGDHFIYHHADGGHHHHVVCSGCGRSVDLDDDLFLPVEATVEAKTGFTVALTHVVMRGLCSECRARGVPNEETD